MLHDNLEKYSELLKKVDAYSAYHEPKFLLAEEKAEESPIKIFVYDDGEKIALLPSIKRDIGKIQGLEKFGGYFDLKTPHEYSAVIASEASEILYKNFFNALDDYCRQNNIIFQFIRFNPYHQIDPNVAKNCGYNVILSNRQSCVTLQRPLEEILKSFSSSARRNIKTAMRKNLRCEEVAPTKSNVEIFQKLYTASMDRLEAKKFFYFNKDYFENMLFEND